LSQPGKPKSNIVMPSDQRNGKKYALTI